MAAVNSLLFLLTTLAPNVIRPPENSDGFQPPTDWNSTEFSWNSPSVTRRECPKDEYFDMCGSVCKRNCENFDQQFPCPFMHCVRGCFCKDDMVRGPEGNCIYPEECPNELQLREQASWFPYKECPEHEVYTCGAHCQRRCKKSWWPCPGWCVPGCECIWPRVRGPNGDCIFQDQCPTSLAEVTTTSSETTERCGSDEEVSCYSHCQKNCSNYDHDIHCPIYCVNGCVCKDPLIRGPDGSCILPGQCAALSQQKIPIPRICSADERFSPCQGHCQKNCSNFDQDVSCLKICLPGCLCKEPLIRGPDGTCIPPEQCPASSTDTEQTTYEYYTSTSPSVRQNWNDFTDTITDDQTDDEEWVPSVVSTINNNLQDEIHSCSHNEKYDECGGSCPRTCDNFNDVIPCPANCVPDCVCKPPMVRGPEGNCIFIEECPQMKPQKIRQDVRCPFKYSEWMTDCRRMDEFVCVDEEAFQNERHLRTCISNCLCIRPRVLSVGGKCVLPEECPSDTLRQQSVPIGGTEAPEFGKMANFRILPDFPKLPDLPKLKCKENEEFSLCASICPDNCTNYNETGRLCKRICLPGCRCKQGYVVGNEGTCIRKEDCKETRDYIHNDCTELEYYDDCGNDCEANCSNHDEYVRDCDNKDCKKGCFCNSGYVRSTDGKCILPSECPDTKPQLSSLWD